MFDENGLDPDPALAISDGRWLIWEFERPDGEVLQIDFDARIEPGVQAAWIDATTQILEGGRPVTSVDYRTWVMP